LDWGVHVCGNVEKYFSCSEIKDFAMPTEENATPVEHSLDQRRVEILFCVVARLFSRPVNGGNHYGFSH
jgi:hypothetical protein